MSAFGLPPGAGTPRSDEFSKRIQDAKKRLDDSRSATPRQTGPEAKIPASAKQSPDGAETRDQADAVGTGPVGQGEYVVKPGDCISQIAKDTGHFWETIWNHAPNAELKDTRKDPNVLLPGDRVAVPELEDKAEDCATEQHHRFRRKGEPAKLRLRLMREPEQPPQEERSDEGAQVGEVDEQTTASTRDTTAQADEPRANVPYTVEIDGQLASGQTDDDGCLELNIPGNARSGTLRIEPGTVRETVIPLVLGALSPISEISGVKHRLNNLGFACGDESDEPTPRLEAALTAFQEKHGLEQSGQADQATRDQLQQVHGS